MSATGSWPLQQGIVAAIRSNVAITIPVYDAVPEGVDLPYIIVGDGEEKDASTFGQIAHDCYPDISVWTRDGETSTATSGAAGYKVGKLARDLIVETLRDGFAVDGHDVAVLDPEYALEETQPDQSDPSLRRVGLKMHILLEDS